jgi:murein L,D-transpeptidase YcbB/YkuD
MTRKLTEEEKAANKAKKAPVATQPEPAAPVVEAPKAEKAKADKKGKKAEKTKTKAVYTPKTLAEITRIYYAVKGTELWRNRRALVGTIEGQATADAAHVRAVIADAAERKVFETYLADVKTPDGAQVTEGQALINLANDLRANGQIRPANAVTGKREAKSTASIGLVEVLEKLLKGTPGVKDAQRVAAKRGNVVEVDYEGQTLQVVIKSA